jgi:hypothetical protein
VITNAAGVRILARGIELEHRFVGPELSPAAEAPAAAAPFGAVVTGDAVPSAAAQPADEEFAVDSGDVGNAEVTLVQRAEAPAAVVGVAASEPAGAVREPDGAPSIPIDAPYEFDPGNLFETRLPGSVEVAAIRELVADEGAETPAAEPPRPAPSTTPTPSSVVAASQVAPAVGAVASGMIAAVPGAPSPVGGTSLGAGEHDGLTVTPAQLKALREGIGVEGTTPPPPPSSFTVHAVRCAGGHVNSPRAERCRTCGATILDRTITLVPRPTLGRLEFSSGMHVALDRRLLIGRKPEVGPTASIDDLPALVAVPDPESLLSRVHAEVRVEGWDAVIVDVDSRNGTFVVPPGATDTMRLRPREPFPLGSGTKVLLGDVASFVFVTEP